MRAIYRIVVKHLSGQRVMTLSILSGITFAMAIAMSIPVYADAAYQKIYTTGLGEATRQGSSVKSRPPYAFMYDYFGSLSGPVVLEDFKPVDQYLSGTVATDLGLRSRLFVRYLQTDLLRLFPTSQSAYQSTQDPLEWINIASLSGINDQIVLVEGRAPEAVAEDSGGPILVLASQALATEIGLKVDELFIAYTQYSTKTGQILVQIPIKISGIWRATDSGSNYWFYDTASFDKVLLVPEASMFNRVLPLFKKEIYTTVWYWVMDGSQVNSSQVPGLVERINAIEHRVENLLPHTRLEISPLDMLNRYRKSAQLLTIYLVTFSTPLLVMIIIFIVLMMDIVMTQRHNEIAVMRARGAKKSLILGISVIESALLSLIGLIIALPLSQVIALIFSKVVSFLDFSAPSDLKFAITLPDLKFGLAALVIVMAAQVIPTLSAAQHSIISYKQERARQLRLPFWQRAWLDVLLLLLAVYGFYLMIKQGGIVLAGGSGNLAANPFQNPLLLLAPAIGILAMTLIILRFLPRLMSAIAWIASKTSSVGVLLAARYLSRTFTGYNAPLILLIFTLSLSTFTASLAQTLDRHFHDQTYYQVGAEINIEELGDVQAGSSQPPTTPNRQADDQRMGSGQAQYWVFLPVSEHLRVPGVAAAARVGRFGLRVRNGSEEFAADYMGIDRVDFPKVAFWRRDFASRALGSLMNDLARASDGVLVSGDFLSVKGYGLGDSLFVNGIDLGQAFQIEFKIVGTFDYFPSWYPEKGPLIVGNLSYFFEQLGWEKPYHVWLKTVPSANYAQIYQGIEDIFRTVLSSENAATILSAVMQLPERQGFFGLLSVGFSALAFLTILGFLHYVLFSFRTRFIELGILRAIGLSTRQMLFLLASELGFLFVVGLGVGTGLGVWISNLFIPMLQAGGSIAAQVPPFQVQINWLSVFQIYSLIGLMFVAALGILTAMLVRMKIFQAIKLGETI